MKTEIEEIAESLVLETWKQVRTNQATLVDFEVAVGCDLGATQSG